MTVQVQTPRTNHTANGVQNTFAYDFQIQAEAHLDVYEDGVLTTKSYSVTGVGNPSGGTVVFSPTVPADQVIVSLVRDVPLDQQTDYQPYDPFPAETHEDALDKLTQQNQDQQDAIDRSLKVPVSDNGDISAVLPPYDAGKGLMYSESGPQEIITSNDNLNGITDAAQASADAAAASAAAAAGSAAAADATLKDFETKYLGAYSADPTTDNEGNPLITGALYWNTIANHMRVWDGATWLPIVQDTYLGITDTATAPILFISDRGVGVGKATELGWDPTLTALQVGGMAAIYTKTAPAAGVSFQVGNNVYSDGTNSRYIIAGSATRYFQIDERHVFQTAPSGAANGIITFTTKGEINNTGIHVQDNIVYYAGTSDDLQLYHDGAQSWLLNTNGTLNIRNALDSGLVAIRADDSGGTSRICAQFGGATPNARLFHGGIEQIQTTGIGVSLGAFSSSGASEGTQIRTEGRVDTSRTVTTTVNHAGYYNPNGLVGSVTTSGTTTAFNTTSDKTLKTSVGLLTDPFAVLNQLEVHEFYFNSDPDTLLHGWMAQDVHLVYPQVVTPGDEESPWGIDQSKFTPILMAAVQQLKTLYDALEARVTALETV